MKSILSLVIPNLYGILTVYWLLNSIAGIRHRIPNFSQICLILPDISFWSFQDVLNRVHITSLLSTWRKSFLYFLVILIEAYQEIRLYLPDSEFILQNILISLSTQ